MVFCQAGGVETEVGGERPREPLTHGKTKFGSM